MCAIFIRKRKGGCFVTKFHTADRIDKGGDDIREWVGKFFLKFGIGMLVD